MPLTNMSQMLQDARKGGYAIGAFNILDYNSFKAVVEAAEEVRSPVIVQTSVKTVKHWGYVPIITWYKELATRTSVPVAIHLDHCKDLEVIRSCIEKGWTSVMIDASSLPFEENLNLSRQVVEMARPNGITVEAELGEIGGVEDDLVVDQDSAHLANPDKVLEFLAKVDVDCFAPAIGTAHGVYRGEPKISFGTLEAISSRTLVPLALHGGTGLSREVFRKCISLGCAKVNISTQLKYAHMNGFTDYHRNNPEEYNPLSALKAQYEALKMAVKENILLFQNKA
jgi:ketose-bisphosphate aldolase